jgi:uncharacterized protein
MIFLKIDLTILENIGNKKHIDTEISFKNLSFRKRDIIIPEMLTLTLDIYTAEKSFIFTGSLEGKLILECSRCLENFPYNIKIDIDKNIEINEVKDLKRFDVNEMLEKDIFLSLPIKSLCSEDCKGLCSQCGQNLNDGECDCDNENIDPRLAELKNFYNEDGNE